MSESKWNIFEDKRYDSEMQICRQCNKFHETSSDEDGLGICSFLNKLHSPHQLEWAVALSNIMCDGFDFKVNKKK